MRKLREKLAREGLFDAARKRPLPAFPRRIAFVTSPTGAAIRDFLEVLRRRWRGADVLIVPVRVQGIGAAEEISRAIAAVNRLAHPIDVLVVGRGGGSLEDLWAFNEEPVVRAIHASRIPVVSAVGHEIDVTLADLVADLRALTPSEAAERIVPAIDEVLAGLKNQHKRLAAALRGRVADARARLDGLAGRRVLRKPFDRLHDLGRQLDQLDARGRDWPCGIDWRRHGSRPRRSPGRARIAQPAGRAGPRLQPDNAARRRTIDRRRRRPVGRRSDQDALRRRRGDQPSRRDLSATDETREHGLTEFTVT